jgi:hypothetical protein
MARCRRRQGRQRPGPHRQVGGGQQVHGAARTEPERLDQGAFTVTGMLTGAGPAGRRHHDLADRCFVSAGWCPDQLGLVLLDLSIAVLVAADAPIVLAVDDTYGAAPAARSMAPPGIMTEVAPAATGPPGVTAGWWSASSAPPLFLRRAICLPLLARLWIPAERDHTPLVLARELLDLVVAQVGDRRVDLVGDAASIGKPLQGLPDPGHRHRPAALRCCPLPAGPAPPGRCGRPRVKGDRLPELIVLAGMTRYRWTPSRCYGQTLQREVLAIGCLWYGALKAQPVQVVLSSPVGAPDGYELALATTDLAATPAQVIEALQPPLGSRNRILGQPPSRRRRPGPHPHPHPPLGGAPDPLRAGRCEPGDRLVRPPRPPRR